MIATLELLETELAPYKDTLVLNFFEVVRLDGVLKDDDGELYWIYDTHKGKVYSSACCGWKPLRD